MLDDLIKTSADFIDRHSFTICFAWTAALLVVFGSSLAGFVKDLAKGWHFILRVLFFILICGFGYGLLTVFLANMLDRELSRLADIWQIIAPVVAFFLIGLVAEKKRQI